MATGARRVRQRPEELLQRACVDFLRLAMPPPPDGAVWWHTPNQRGTRAKYEAAILKALGVRAGIPDLLFLHQGRLLAVELKAPGGGSLTERQRETQELLEQAGAIVLSACRSVDELAHWLSYHRVPLKAMP